MQVRELFEAEEWEREAKGDSVHANWRPSDANDRQHHAQMKQTGFWGKMGAGCLILARQTGRFLIAHRSRAVEQPGTWGTWGGAIDSGLSPEAAVKQEIREETGYPGKVALRPLYVFEAKKGDQIVFRYFNFLAVVDEEFEPQLNWESQGFRWCAFGDWPTPLHFGLKAVLADPASITTMQKAIRHSS